jgi:predicted Zn-ribbon and HTH transcriptional regulator
MYRKLLLLLSAIVFIAASHANAQQMQGMEGKMEMVKSPEMNKIRSDLKKTKSKLAKKGHYACCNKPTCDFCGISMNSCQCGDNVRSGKGGVCGECKGGWKAGYGAIPGKTADEIKMVTPEEAKMGYGMRAKMFEMDVKDMNMKKK